MNFIQKIVYFILELQEKVLMSRLKGSLNNTYTSKTTKTIVTKGCTLNLASKTEQNKQLVKKNVEQILRETKCSPEKLIEYVKNNGTKVYVIPSARHVLSIINEEEGFIVGVGCLKALFLNLILNKKPSFKLEPLFIVSSKEPEQFGFIHQFYKWYSWKLDLPGFDCRAQESFKKFNNPKKSGNLDEVNLNDMMAMKEAIARDIEAIDFVFKMVKGGEGGRQAMAKITAGGASV